MADMIADVGPVETGDDQPVLGNAELGQNVGARPPVRGRGQRQSRHLRMIVEEAFELAVVGTEVVPPFADAMRLVDRDQRQLHLDGQAPEAIEGRPFRCDIEEIQLAVPEALDRPLAVPIGGRQRGRVDAERFGRADLVVHQRDQRRDDQRRAVASERRQLIAERLARAGRHHGKRVLTGNNSANDILLHPAECMETENGLENRLRVAGHSAASACKDRARRACRKRALP